MPIERAPPSADTSPEAKAVARTQVRRPYSAPQRRLEVHGAEEGYHYHFFKEANIPRAQQAGYDFVDSATVTVNSRSVGADSMAGQSNDLGSHVVIQHQGETLVLMRIKEEWYNEDMALLQERNIAVWKAIFRNEQIAGVGGVNPGDTSNSYVKQATVEGRGSAALRRNQPLMSRTYK